MGSVDSFKLARSLYLELLPKMRFLDFLEIVEQALAEQGITE